MIKDFYVINLERKIDRWDECYTNIMKSSLKNYKINKFCAFDGYNIDNELKRFNIENNVIFRFIKKTRLRVAMGEFGCLMSHYLLLKQISENDKYKDDDYIGILEDDFHYSNNFETNFDKLQNMDLLKHDVEFLYIGGRFTQNYMPDNLNTDMFEKIDNNLFYRKNRYSAGKNWDRTTHSYIVKKSICKKLADLISIKFVSDTEYIYGQRCFVPIDHLLAHRYKDIKMFDFLPHLFYCPINYKSDIQHLKYMTVV